MTHKPGCTGKREFGTFTQAKRGAVRLNRRDQGAHVEPYHCKFCHRSHVGEARDHGQMDARKATS